MKRCISLLLTVCLLATMAAVPALAEAGHLYRRGRRQER